ncbi:MAG: hypothetical protein KIH08_09665 [Candidatus Freyarchaeota archaeon]|nr:hypothetical protein [Candidatus Jordarchaeia archaeon]MBS7268030.1 hypothetical protein [Candidatus Jordarchaeia archaeon]MBS7278905.1 hypothetical protein [Candidatus Jordarchaeia archaeon]
MSQVKRIIILSLFIILVTGLGFSQTHYGVKQTSNVNWLLLTPTTSSYSGDSNTQIASLEKVTFTHMPLDDEAYDYIRPLGNLNPPYHTFPTDHIYFGLKNETYNIYAPAKGIITQINNWTAERGGAYQDYSLQIKHSLTFKSYFHHMSGLADWILEKVGEVTEFTPVFIPVEAGQVIGWAEKQPGGSQCLDWGAIDDKITLSFIHPETYFRGVVHGDVNVHAVCPLDYLEESLREKAYQKVIRLDEPRGGKIDYDLLGRASGNWFLEGSPSGIWNNSALLALVYHVHNASQMVVSVGGNVLAPLPIGVFNATGPDFRGVSAESGKTIYHLVGDFPESVKGQNYTLVVQVVGDERIRVEAFTGHQGEVNFTENAVFYCRTGPYAPLYFERLITLSLAILNQHSTSFKAALIVLGAAGGVAVLLALTFVLLKKGHQ